MATKISLEFNFRNQRFTNAQKGLEALGRSFAESQRVLAPALRRELQTYLKAVRFSLLQRHSKPFVNPTNAPATGEDALLKRRGGIRKIRTKTKGGMRLDQVRGELMIPFPLSVHEDGTTITARRAKFLTIPLPAALDSRGVPLRRNARAWDKTFVQMSKRGNLLIFQRRGTMLVPLYLLKKSVVLPPRLKAQETLRAGEDFFVDSAIDAMTTKLLAAL